MLNSNACSVSDQMGEVYMKIIEMMLQKMMIVKIRVMIRQWNINKYMGKNENIMDNNQNHENNESEVDRKKEWDWWNLCYCNDSYYLIISIILSNK